jgi:hypothetical protein
LISCIWQDSTTHMKGHLATCWMETTMKSPSCLPPADLACYHLKAPSTKHQGTDSVRSEHRFIMCLILHSQGEQAMVTASLANAVSAAQFAGVCARFRAYKIIIHLLQGPRSDRRCGCGQRAGDPRDIQGLPAAVLLGRERQ